jgi:hypothetical protein
MSPHTGVTLAAWASLALSSCTTVCIETSARDPQAVAKWEMTIEKIEPQDVCNPKGITLTPSRGQRVSVINATGRLEIVQPVPEQYHLHVGQQVLLVADHGRLWVQPIDYPLPPELRSLPASPGAVSELESKLHLQLPAGWSPRPVTDVMRSGGIIYAAQNTTLDIHAELRAYHRSEITDLVAFTESLEAALASILDKTKSSAVTPATVNGRAAARFEVEGVSRKAPIGIGYVGTVIQGETEIAYIVAWASIAAFPAKRDALAHIADEITGL